MKIKFALGPYGYEVVLGNITEQIYNKYAEDNQALVDDVSGFNEDSELKEWSDNDDINHVYGAVFEEEGTEQYLKILDDKETELLNIPLTKESEWACMRILEHNNDSIFAFPRYTSVNSCKANSASAALNKWLKSKLKDDYVVHGFRHSFRDRLRAKECPSEIIDQLGGWSLRSVGQGYGKGYELSVLSKWIKQI